MLEMLLYIGVSGMLVAHAWTSCLDDDMIFERIGEWLGRQGKWAKALTCSYCFTFWATAIMFVLYSQAFPAWFAITTVSLAMFLNHLLTYNNIIE